MCHFFLPLSLSLSVNFLGISRFRPSAHKQFSYVLPVIHAHDFTAIISFPSTACVLPLDSFLSCMAPVLSSSRLPSCLILLFVLYSPHTLSHILVSFLTVILLPWPPLLSSATQGSEKVTVLDIRWSGWVAILWS